MSENLRFSDTVDPRIDRGEQPKISPLTEHAQSQKSTLAVGLLIFFAMCLHAFVAGSAASVKSATFDEPLHVLGGLLQWRYGDFRLNPEHPPLWKYLAGVAMTGLPFEVDLDQPQAQEMLHDLNRQERWAVNSLFRNPKANGPELVARARLGMLIFGVSVVLLAGLWARQLAGNIAGAITAIIVALDPMLLGHSGLVTNDVACTASILACFWFAWRLSKRVSITNVLLFSVACSVAAVTKFTALALPLFLAPAVILRLMRKEHWQTRGEVYLDTARARFIAILLVILFVGAFSWLCIWATYGFRYSPCPDLRLSFNVDHPTELYKINLQNRFRKVKQRTASFDRETTRLLKLCQLANRYQLLPQAFLQGIGYAQAMSIAGVSYLDGELIQGGTPSYFIRAWLYKTPLTIIVAVALTVSWLVWITVSGKLQFHYDFAFLVFPYAVILGVGLSYDLNIGLRHMLPAYPLVWIGMGIISARLYQFKKFRPILAAALMLFVVESLSAFPNYIAYFNPAFGQQRGLDRLSDSNLDWGQDLVALSKWQQQNPSVTLYLAYFGSADPAAYGIRYINVAPGYFYGPKPEVPDPNRPGVLAISATWLQGNYLHWLEGTFLNPEEVRRELQILRQRAQPLTILGGGSIYLYEFPLKSEVKRGFGAENPNL